MSMHTVCTGAEHILYGLTGLIATMLPAFQVALSMKGIILADVNQLISFTHNTLARTCTRTHLHTHIQ